MHFGEEEEEEEANGGKEHLQYAKDVLPVS